MQTISLRMIALAGVLLTGVALTGCNDNQQAATPPTVVNSTPAPAPATTTVVTPGAAPAAGMVVANRPDTKINTNAGPGGSTGTDQTTAKAVNDAILTNKQMTGARVEPVVTGGVCRLTGTVQNQIQKALAGKTASQTAGVSSVVNKLTIISTGGAKPKTIVVTKTKPVVVTKTKTVIVHVHDKPASPADNGTGDTNAPATPETPETPQTPATPGTGTGQ